MKFKFFSLLILVGLGVGLGIPLVGHCKSSDFIVYSIYRELNLGNPQEVPQKDYYVNMGSLQGVHVGTILEVMRKVSSYDLIHVQLYRDVVFPIGFIKVIHAETNAAIARLEKMLPVEVAPIANPRAIVVGDLVRISD